MLCENVQKTIRSMKDICINYRMHIIHSDKYMNTFSKLGPMPKKISPKLPAPILLDI